MESSHSPHEGPSGGKLTSHENGSGASQQRKSRREEVRSRTEAEDISDKDLTTKWVERVVFEQVKRALEDPCLRKERVAESASSTVSKKVEANCLLQPNQWFSFFVLYLLTPSSSTILLTALLAVLLFSFILLRLVLSRSFWKSRAAHFFFVFLREYLRPDTMSPAETSRRGGSSGGVVSTGGTDSTGGAGGMGAQASLFLPDQIGAWMRMNMPLPGTPGAPLFKGPNVSRFVKTVESLFTRHYIASDKDKLSYLADYCSDSISVWLSSLSEYDGEDYDKVIDCLKTEYAGQDETLKRFNPHWLQHYKNQRRKDASELDEFLRTFHFVSENLVKRKLLSAYLRAAWFLEGLPEFLQIKLVEDLSLDINREDTIEYGRIRTAVQSFLRVNKTLQYIRSESSGHDQLESRREDDEIRNSVLIQPDGSYPKLELKKAREPFHTRTTEEAVSRAAVDKLTEELSQLKITVAEQRDRRPVTMSPYSNRRFPPGVEAPATRQGGVEPAGRPSNWVNLTDTQCRYCREEGHIRRHCPHLQAHLAQSLVHFDAVGRVCWGAPNTDGSPLRFDDAGKSMKGQVEERNRALDTNFLGFDFDSIRFGHYVDYSTDEEAEPFHVSSTQGVSAAKDGRVTKYPDSVTRQQKEKLKTALGREEGLPAVRSQRSGRYRVPEVREEMDLSSDEEKPPGKDPGPSSAARVPEPFVPSRILQKGKEPIRGEAVKTGPSNSVVPRVRKVRISDELKGKTGPITLINRFLDQQASITLRELIGVSPAVHKTLFAPFDPATNVSSQDVDDYVTDSTYTISNIEGSLEGDSEDEEVLYTAATMKINVVFAKAQNPIRVLLDGGSEINLVHRSIADRFGLPITLHCGGEMRSAANNMTPFAGICEQTPIRIGSFKYKVPFFVIDQELSHPVILGRPFEHQARVQYLAKPNGAVDVVFISMDRKQELVMQAFSRDNPRNQTRDQVIHRCGKVTEIEGEK